MPFDQGRDERIDFLDTVHLAKEIYVRLTPLMLQLFYSSSDEDDCPGCNFKELTEDAFHAAEIFFQHRRKLGRLLDERLEAEAKQTAESQQTTEERDVNTAKE